SAEVGNHVVAPDSGAGQGQSEKGREGEQATAGHLVPFLIGNAGRDGDVRAERACHLRTGPTNLTEGSATAKANSCDNPVSPERFGATLFHAPGVPPGTRLGAGGFTRPASAGQPIREWFV